jgi:hypothetical protein
LSPGTFEVHTFVPLVSANVEPEPISPRAGAGVAAGIWAGVGAGITGVGCTAGGAACDCCGGCST